MRYLRKDTVQNGRNFTSVTALGKVDQGGDTPYGRVWMKHASETPNFDQATRPLEGMPTTWTPTELFTHTPPQITSAHADPSLRHSVPTMVALALQRSGGRTIMADSSLSQFSSRLSQNAAERGLPVVGDPKNPNMGTTSTFEQRIDRKTVHIDPHDEFSMERHFGAGNEPVSDEDVRSARTTVRNMLRPAKKLTSPQFKDYVDVPLPGI